MGIFSLLFIIAVLVVCLGPSNAALAARSRGIRILLQIVKAAAIALLVITGGAVVLGLLLLGLCLARVPSH